MVYLLSLEADGWVKWVDTISTIGEQTGAEELAAIEDIDGNGTRDLAIGQYWNNDFMHQAGAVWVLQVDSVLGTRYCTSAMANSTGEVGRMELSGSELVSQDDLTLTATQLPPESNIGYFIMGTGISNFTPPGSAGPICVSPGIQRFLPPVNNTTELGGGFARTVGMTGPISGNITAGSTWNFQAWHRDLVAGSSNLTDAVMVEFYD